MVRPPLREQETQELIRRFQAKRAHSRQIRLVAAGLGGAVFLAAVVVAVVLAVQASGSQADNGSAGGPGPATSSTLTSSTATASTATTSAGGTTTSMTTAGGTPTTTGRAPTTAGATTSAGATTTGRVTTTAQATTTSASSATSTAGGQAAGKVVVIDPGHQAHGDYSLEPIGPGSSEKKAKVSSGTSGVATGAPESKLVLAVGLKLRDALEARGVKVVMTRTTQDINISNIQRAQIANKAGADLFVRVHADGSDNAATAGIHVLYPVSINGWTDDIAAASKKAASLAQGELIAATGAKDRGIDARSDMTGFNWSDVPVILPEIGFMTNAAEDRLLATAAYQDKIVAGLTRAILSFLGVS
ncbi:MAG: N-acetylmuramoyl-L-alanine amidase [bacterium]